MISSLLSLVPGSAVGLLVLTVTFAVVIQILLLFLKRWKTDSQLKGIPRPPGHWFWGNSHELGEYAHKNFEKWLEKYGPVYCLRSGLFVNAVVLSDPDSVKSIMSTSEPKYPGVYDLFEPWIGDGLLVSRGKKWLRTRRLLTPGFHFQILKPYVGIFSDSAHIMMNKWRESIKENPRVEMFSNISLMMLDSLLKCAYGSTESIQKGGRSRNAYTQAIFDITELVIQRIADPMTHNNMIYGLTKDGKKFFGACKTIHDYSQAVIEKKRREKQNETPSERDKKTYLDFLDILLEAKDADGVGLTDTEIQHEVDTFMFEGHDTTTSGMSFFIYNMARHPEHQKKCVEEVEEVLGDRENVTWDDLAKFEYLTMCVKETLRLQTTVSWVSRQITKPMTVPSGYTIPEGTWVISALHGVHHNPEVWPDPHKFDPLRFSLANSKDRSPHAFIPFAAGPRNCIGQHFALNELKTCGALLLRNFEFEVTHEPETVYQVVLRAKGGLWVNVKERKGRHT